MKFLLIGGLGYIGQVLQLELRETSHSFKVIDNDLMSLHQWENKLDIVNYEDFNEISNSIKDSDVIVNLAAVVGDQGCLVDTKLSIKVNCEGIKHIVALCNKFNKKIIHTSTCSIYGADKDLLTEKSQTFPVDFYGQTKYQQERYILENSKDFCIFRLGTAHGWSPRMRFDLVVNTFIAKVFNKEQLIVHGGNQWRPFVHIRDVARAIIFAAENNLSEVYNLANENISIAELANLIAKGDVKVEVNDFMSDPRNYKINNSKILATGFKFKWNLIKGIAEIKEHSDDLKNYKDAKYSNYKMMVLKKL